MREAKAKFAVWKAFGFQPTPEVLEALEQVAFQRWSRSPTALPNL